MARKEYTTDPTSTYFMTKKALEAGFAQVGDTLYICPVCRAKFMKAHRGHKGTGQLFDRAVRKAIMFQRADNRLMVACPCGYRCEQVDDEVPTCKCGNPLPEGRSMYCYSCRKPAKAVAVDNGDGTGSFVGELPAGMGI